MKQEAKILLYDLETTPNVALTWGKWEQNVIRFLRESELLSFAYQWLGEKKVTVVTRMDFPGYSEKALLKALWAVQGQADIVVAHNGNSFDNKRSNTGFLKHQLGATSPYRSIDTKLEAKKHFRFNGNSLEDLARFLGIGVKKSHDGIDTWLACMNPLHKEIRQLAPFSEREIRAAWKTMSQYNGWDVNLLKEVYLYMRPYMKSHPNVSQIVGRPSGCPSCGGTQLQARGLRYTKRSAYTRYMCMGCHGWCRAATPINQVKPEIVNL